MSPQADEPHLLVREPETACRRTVASGRALAYESLRKQTVESSVSEHDSYAYGSQTRPAIRSTGRVPDTSIIAAGDREEGCV